MSAVGKAPTMGSEIRKCVAASAKDLGETASEYCDQVRIRAVDAVEELSSRGQKTRDAAAVVARGAHEVARGGARGRSICRCSSQGDE